MISLHGGRLLLHCDRADRTWHCTIALGPRHRLTLDTRCLDLAGALLAAQRFYQAELAQARRVGDPPLCWDCNHWDPQRSGCALGFPESRRTGGRFAARCEVFKLCP